MTTAAQDHSLVVGNNGKPAKPRKPASSGVDYRKRRKNEEHQATKADVTSLDNWFEGV